MDDFVVSIPKIPAHQQPAIPGAHGWFTNAFVPFGKDEIEQSIPHRFEQMVRKYPTRLAVKTKSQTLTYHTLNTVTNRVARAILAQCGEGNEPVAFLLEHDTSAIIGILGVLKAGKCYVPLDPSQPAARTRYILEDTQASLVVTNNKNLSVARQLTEDGVPLINIDKLDPELSGEDLGLSIPPDTFAYIIYTSGTTGQPKGVIQNHRNVLHKTFEYTNSIHIGADERLVLLYPPSFSGAVRDIFSALLNAATLLPFDIKQEGLTNLASWLIQEEITIYNSAATVFRHFVSTLTGQEQFPKLRLVNVGSETVDKRDVELYKKHFSPDCLFVARLGATEISPIRQYFINKETPISGSTVPTGYAVEDTEVLLLAQDSTQVGCNEIGEIAVKSCYLSPGYWRKPDLTAAAFLPDPEGGAKRIYRTGDLGRLLPDGCLLHLGRKDFQVKVAGYRVEVAEIETALLTLDTVKDAVVVGREDRTGDTRLVAYLVPAREPAPTVTTLRRALLDRLPEYMLPSHFVMLNTFPRTPIGKVDYQALPMPDATRPELESLFVSPRTSGEEVLAQIWREVLDLDQVGIHDNFFELGGNSLLAVRLFAQIEHRLGKGLPLAVLLQAPTIQQLVDILRLEKWAPRWSSLVAIQSEGANLPLFLVHAGGGEVLFYRDLARHLGPEQPVYGLQLQGMDGQLPFHTRVQDMAAHYITELRTVQPGGPYLLGGRCMGCIIAFEMAQQLQGQGQTVALVALMDPIVPPRLKSFWYRMRYCAKNLGHSPGVLATHLFRLSRRWGVRKSKKVIGYLFRRLYRLYPVGLFDELALEFLSVLPQAYPGRQYLSQARRSYVPRVYPGRITCFVDSERAPLSPYPWSELATEEVEWRMVPGHKASMFQEPQVQVLAQQLADCVEQVQANQRG